MIKTVIITLALTRAPAMPLSPSTTMECTVMVHFALYTINNLNELSSCTDINECTNGSVGSTTCSEVCVNDPGTFHCDCYPGYTLNSDLVSCSGWCIYLIIRLVNMIVVIGGVLQIWMVFL